MSPILIFACALVVLTGMASYLLVTRRLAICHHTTWPYIGSPWLFKWSSGLNRWILRERGYRQLDDRYLVAAVTLAAASQI